MRFHRSKKILICVAAFLGAVSAQAQFDEGGWRAEMAYVSSYVARGVERAHASAQTALEFSRENFRVTGWANQPFSGAENEAAELNLNAAYTREVGDSVALELSAAHAWFDRVPGRGVERSFEVGVAATFTAATLAGFTPTVGVFRDFRFESNTAQVSFARSLALTKLGTFLDLNFFAGWSDGQHWRPDATGAAREDSYGYWGGELRVPYQIGRYGVMAGLHYADTTARSAQNGPFATGAGPHCWVTLGVSLDF
jgi:hypothetical protein